MACIPAPAPADGPAACFWQPANMRPQKTLPIATKFRFKGLPSFVGWFPHTYRLCVKKRRGDPAEQIRGTAPLSQIFRLPAVTRCWRAVLRCRQDCCRAGRPRLHWRNRPARKTLFRRLQDLVSLTDPTRVGSLQKGESGQPGRSCGSGIYLSSPSWSPPANSKVPVV